VFAITAEPMAVTLTCRKAGKAELALWLPDGTWQSDQVEAAAPTHDFGAGRPPWRLRWAEGQSRRFRKL